MGKLLLRGQAAVLLLLRLGFRRQVPELLLEPPVAVVPGLSLLTMVASAVLHRSGRARAAKHLLQHLVAWGGIPVINESLSNMLEDIGDADHPALLAMTLGMLLDEPLAATIILLMLTGGEALESYAMQRAQTGIHTLLEQEPGTARRMLLDGSTEDVAATDLAPGETIILRNGDSAPVDCTVAAGPSNSVLGLRKPFSQGQETSELQVFEVDESVVTGESLVQVRCRQGWWG